jgi:hypothetical protein
MIVGVVRRDLLVPGLALAAAIVVAGCFEREAERLGREHEERLAAVGLVLEGTLAYPPRGSVPHWVIEATIAGDEVEAEATCATIEKVRMEDGELPYLVRVAFEPAGEVECGWAKDGLGPEPVPSG